MAERIERGRYYRHWHDFLELVETDEVKLVVNKIYDLWFNRDDGLIDFEVCLWAFSDLHEQYMEYNQYCNCDRCSFLPDLV